MNNNNNSNNNNNNNELLTQLSKLNAKFVGGGVPRLCQFCGELFIQYDKRSTAKNCPTCMDIYQQRPSVVKQRETIAYFPNVTIQSLPNNGDWELSKTPDGRTFTNKSYKNDPFYKIDKKGKDYGVNWNGRITIYAKQPFTIGAIVTVRIMKVTHVVNAQYEEKQTLNNGTIIQRNTVAINEYSNLFTDNLPNAELHQNANSVTPNTTRTEVQSYEYIVLEPSKSSVSSVSDKTIGFYQANTKTTLSGLGNQYHYQLTGNPLWSKEIIGGVRNMRKYTISWLAITDNTHIVSIIDNNHPMTNNLNDDTTNTNTENKNEMFDVKTILTKLNNSHLSDEIEEYTPFTFGSDEDDE